MAYEGAFFFSAQVIITIIIIIIVVIIIKISKAFILEKLQSFTVLFMTYRPVF